MEQNSQKNNDPTETGTPKKKTTLKQIVAIGAVVLLVLMYIVTLLAAFLAPDLSGRLFMMCLYATIGIPMLLWIYIWLYQKMTGRED